MRTETTGKANQEALERIRKSRSVLIDMKPAGEVLEGMTRQTILHAGPPITWDRMCGPMKGAVTGALMYEGLAGSPVEAMALAGSGDISFSPCHHFRAVGSMAGVISHSMPVFVVQNKTYGNRAFSILNEGLGKVLRFGAYSPEVLRKLKWMEEIVAPLLQRALRHSGEIDLKNLTAQALRMGDECHNRNKAGTLLFFSTLAPHLAAAEVSAKHAAEVFNYIVGNDHFYLNLCMAGCKAVMDAARDIEGSSLVTAMARNGVDFGIQVSGLGNRWFTAPSSLPIGRYFPGFTGQDANPDLGDSAVTETAGLGAFAMAAAPSIVEYIGGTVEDTMRSTLNMYKITLGENESYLIPCLNFRGTPTGIDIGKVVETGIVPAVDTGIAHRDAGIGQIGAGFVKPPMSCFQSAFEAFKKKYP